MTIQQVLVFECNTYDVQQVITSKINGIQNDISKQLKYDIAFVDIRDVKIIPLYRSEATGFFNILVTIIIDFELMN
jgi:hypothetical protein